MGESIARRRVASAGWGDSARAARTRLSAVEGILADPAESSAKNKKLGEILTAHSGANSSAMNILEDSLAAFRQAR
jgi:hypothetical protein